MRIAQLAPLYEAVPPLRYGGTERVVSWLTEELVRRGHEVTLFASGDSRTGARLVPVVKGGLRLGEAKDPIAPHMLELGLLQQRLPTFDVVHSHLEYLALPMLRPNDPALVTTLHGRLDIPDLAPVYRAFRGQALVSISEAQRTPLPDLSWVATVHHGLPLDEYPMGRGGGDYFLFLGRISPEKRPHVAIDVARRLGVRLVLAAKVEAIDRPYFRSAVEPRLAEPGIEFVGEVDLPGTIRLLGEARALLFPILWPEPFGLAMIESLACGTPIITRQCGSTPEVVTDGETGFVCDSDDALLAAARQTDRLDRGACRRAAEQRFSVGRMADQYEAVYVATSEARRRMWKTSSASTIATTSSPPRAFQTTAPASSSKETRSSSSTASGTSTRSGSASKDSSTTEPAT